MIFFEIEKQCFLQEAFSKQQIAYLLADYNAISLAARVNGEIAGFVIGRIDMERDSLEGHILTVDVAPLHRRKGRAQQLLCEMEAIFRDKGIKEYRL